MSLIQTLDPPSLNPPHPLFANIVLYPISATHSLANIAGQVPIPPPTSSKPKPTVADVPAALADQVRVSLHRIKLCLDHIGAGIEDLCKVTYYLSGDKYVYEEEQSLKELEAVAHEWLSGCRPSACALIVKGLSQREFGCEVSAEAVVRTPTKKTL